MWFMLGVPALIIGFLIIMATIREKGKMKLIFTEPKAETLDDSYSKRDKNENSQSFIDDSFYENKKPSIFDDDFQGIEFPKKRDITTDHYDNDSMFEDSWGGCDSPDDSICKSDGTLRAGDYTI